MDNPHEEPEYTTDIRQIFSKRYTVSKRQLGIALTIMGILGFVAIFALDFVGGGREGGIGPAQQAGLLLMVAVAIFGATLIPLGDDPA
jgi:hypothetical protein